MPPASVTFYFVLAIGARARARAFGRNLFVNAIEMLVPSGGTTDLSFVLVFIRKPHAITSSTSS